MSRRSRRRDGFPFRALSTRWMLGLLVLIGAALRSYRLNSGLWLDEYATLDMVRGVPLRTIFTFFPGESNHPLYSLLAGTSITLFGGLGDWVIRLPAVAFGVAAIPALYLLGARIWDRREGLLAAALLAGSYHHIWFSQNARGYTTLAFFSILATYWLLRCLENARPKFVIGYGVSAGLGLYTHLTMVFLLAGHALASLWMLLRPASDRERRPEWRRLAGCFLLAAAIALALYGPILPQVWAFFAAGPSDLRGVSTPAWALREAIHSLQIGLGVGSSLGLLAGALIFGAGLWSYFHRRRAAFRILVLPAPVTVLGALLVRGTLYPRFFFFLAGMGILILVRGALVAGEFLGAKIVRRPGLEGPAARFGTGLAALLVLASLLSLPAYYRFPKQDYARAATFLDARARQGDVAATLGGGIGPVRRHASVAYRELTRMNELDSLRHERTVWVAYTFPLYVELTHPELLSYVERRCPVDTVFRGTVGGGDIVVRGCPRLPRPGDPGGTSTREAADSP
ncbi:MAG: glycosyltransferase family 39 protein [Gemmatimonadota bacterium]